jgi:hypothetical protein
VITVSGLFGAVDETLERLRHLQRRLERAMATFEDLKRETEEMVAKVQEAIVFIAGLKVEIQALKEAGADPAAVDAVVAKLDQAQADLGGAINPPPPPPGE